MEGIFDLTAYAKQQGQEVYNEGTQRKLASTRMGQLLTTDWKHHLAAAGFVHRVNVGGITAGGDINPVTGGGNGTTVDQDQPEVAIGVDTGYFLIPIEIKVSAQVDMDANAEDADIIATVDRAAGVPTSVTGTPGIVTPVNQLDGAAVFPGRAFGGITADITDPTVSEVLDVEHVQGSDNGTAGNLAVVNFKMDYQPLLPNLIAGPCGLYVYWGGVAAVPGVASVLVAAVPSSWFE